MSYHRVLPLPEALIHHNPTGKQQVGRDSLLQSRTMMSEKLVSPSMRSRSPGSSQQSSSPLVEKRQRSPSMNSMDESDDSPEHRDRSSSQMSNREARRPPSISRSWQAESPSDICLCQPDPKVPRPRNAFILYRQHYQGAVVAQNPGLANPEISKVIGEQWRDSSPEVKAHWKSLADEEKLRHQKQHPNYRYQPRRSGRSNSITGGQAGTSSNEAPRCVKCGRRTLTTPTSMPSMSTNSEERLPAGPRTPTGPNPVSSGTRYTRGPGSPGFVGPLSAAFHHPEQRSYVQHHGLPSPRFKRPSVSGGPQSPTDSKRRRIGPPAHYTPVRLPHGPSTPFPYRRDSLPPPNFLPHPHNGPHNGKLGNGGFAMAPPPRPHPHPHPHPDPSLTLPPIQTHLATLREHEAGGNSQAKSLQGMVMSISPLNKIRVLSKISPPLAAPGPLSPKYATRGVAIAIDGQDEAAIKAITAYLVKELSENNVVKIFELDDIEENAPKKKRSSSTANSGGGKVEAESDRTYDAYLALTRRYHALSSSVIAFLTTAPTSPTTTSPQPLAPDDDSDSPISPKTIPKPKTRSAAAFKRANAHQSPEEQARTAAQLKGLPIALLPRWALTHADLYACSLPITDAYAPIDHWQWMATLWRGIVGADITVAVRSAQVPAETPTTAEMVKTAAATGSGSAGSAKASVGSAGGKGVGAVVGQAVDVRLEDARAIVLRALEGGGVPEGSLRRVGFEVGEWIRAAGEKGRRES